MTDGGRRVEASGTLSPPGTPGTIATVTAYSNPLLKRMRQLRDKKHRRAEGLFLAEGLRILADGMATGRTPRYLFHAQAGLLPDIARQVIDRTLAPGGAVIETTPDILGKLSGKDNPQAMVGVYHDHWTPLDRLDRDSAPIWLVAERMRDPGNLGTILRIGDAVGAGGLILLDECADAFGTDAVRASMGAVFSQSITGCARQDFIGWLRRGAGCLVAATLADDAVDYEQPDYGAEGARPTFVMVGNEAQGLPAELAAAADLRVTMPMLGRADSLNAAMAMAVLAYRVLSKHRARDGAPMRGGG